MCAYKNKEKYNKGFPKLLLMRVAQHYNCLSLEGKNTVRIDILRTINSQCYTTSR